MIFDGKKVSFFFADYENFGAKWGLCEKALLVRLPAHLEEGVDESTSPDLFRQNSQNRAFPRSTRSTTATKNLKNLAQTPSVSPKKRRKIGPRTHRIASQKLER